MTVYVVGNPLVNEDSLPVRMLPLLRERFPDVSFVEFEPTEDLPDDREPVFLDTVSNAKEVMVFRDLDRFVETKALSLHDFDLGLTLKLALKAGLIDRVTIIGVPPSLAVNVAVEEVGRVIASLS